MAPSLPRELAVLLPVIQRIDAWDVLLLVRVGDGRSLSPAAVARELRLAASTAERELAFLCGRGFLTVTLGSDLRYAYRPPTPAVDRAIADLAALGREAVVHAFAQSAHDLPTDEPFTAFDAVFNVPVAENDRK